MATHLTWTRKSYWRARGPDGEYVAKESGSTNFATPEELWEGIANSPLRGEFDVEPARFRVSKGYGVLSPDTGDTSPPTVPTNLSGSPLSASSIYLSWTASTDNVGVTEYQVYRNGVPIDTTQDTTYTDTGLTPSTQYSYQVSASDAAGNSSALTSAAQVTTNANTAPSWSTSAQSLTIGVAYSLALSSVCSDVDGHALTFTQVSGTLPAGLTFSNGVVSGTPTTAQAPSVTFRASDGYTTTDQVITFTVTQADTTPPDVPTGLAVGTPASNSLPLSWDANPSGQGLAGYKLYRSTNGVNYGLHQTIAAGTTTYNDGSLNADTTYYYKLSAFDNATPVANESAQSAAVSGRTAVASTLTWSGNPFPMTVPAGSYVDLEQYISDPANELGSVISIGAAFPSGASITGPPTVATWRVAASSGATLGETTGHQLRLVRSGDSDWQRRIAGSNVVWYHNFESAAEVNQFRWASAAGGNDPGATAPDSSYLSYDATDGVGGGCLKWRHPAGSYEPDAAWWRPFFPISGAQNGRGVDDPAANGSLTLRNWTPATNDNMLVNSPYGYYGNSTYHAAHPGQFDGTEYWLQFRVKVDLARAQTVVSGGKFWYQTTNFQSLTSQEIVTYPDVRSVGGQIVLRVNRSGGIPADQDPPGDTINGQQVNSEYGYCDVVSSPGGCWAFTGGWDVLMYHVRPGTNSGNDTLLEIWAAPSTNPTVPVRIWNQTNMDLPFDSASGRPKGINAFLTVPYGQSTYNAEYGLKFCQMIFSKSSIPWPAV